MVFKKPMPSMPKYTKYIKVKPKLLRLHAPYIRKNVAIKKKMYAMNIGGFGEYHIRINEAIRLDIIPITSKQNLFGFDLKSSRIHCNVVFLPILAMKLLNLVSSHCRYFLGTFFIPYWNKVTFVHKPNANQSTFT